MTSRQIAVVALKCFAIYVLFKLMVVYPHWVISFRHSLAACLPWGESLIVTVAAPLIGGAVMVGFAGLAWRLAHGLAMLAVAPPVEEVRVAVTPRRLEEIGFRVLDVYCGHWAPGTGPYVRIVAAPGRRRRVPTSACASAKPSGTCTCWRSSRCWFSSCW